MTDKPDANTAQSKVRLNRHQRRAKETAFRKMVKALKKNPPPYRCPQCRSQNVEFGFSADTPQQLIGWCYDCNKLGWPKEDSARVGTPDNGIRQAQQINSDGRVQTKKRNKNKHKVIPSGWEH